MRVTVFVCSLLVAMSASAHEGTFAEPEPTLETILLAPVPPRRETVPPTPVATVQGDPTSDEHARHSLYVEALGPGGLGSLSYDYRFVEDAAFRIGVGFFALGIFGPAKGFVTVPLTLSYLAGASNHRLELGGGVTLAIGIRDTDIQPVAVVLLGYRYQRVSGGFMLRVGINAFLRPDLDEPLVFLPLPYLALGLTF